ncbi:MAG: response regulator transcription factor [Xanthomonadales bacterium]|nr:Alkaline phosphatase synthesis transcriptional regulatory protein PhoP [Xanthomonadales bacterium]MCC6592951.1 response regulator transcription factor [Xanthomonadales bacterium]
MASPHSPAADTNRWRIALVEDSAFDAALYSAWIEAAGHAAVVYPSAAEFRRRLGVESVDAIVLDWSLPDANGLALLEWLRQGPNAGVPVVFLTSHDVESDVVAALRAGADDYVAKPARAGELVARIEAALRRTGNASRQPAELQFPPFRFDLRQRRLYQADSCVETTAREFDLLCYLFRRHGRIVSREMLLSEVWKMPGQVSTRSIDTHISRLRKRLGLAGESGWRLQAIYQHGYRLQRDEPDAAA